MRRRTLPIPLAVGSAVIMGHLLVQERLRRRDGLLRWVAGRTVQGALVRVLVLLGRGAAAEV